MVSEVFIELVEVFKASLPIKDILELFDVAKSTYYRWKENCKFDTKLSFNE